MNCPANCTCCKSTTPKRVVPEDKISIARIELLHPKLRVSARAIYEEVRALGIRMRITSTFRSFAEQQAIYNQGRTTKGPIVSWALPGTSWHNYGMAFDFSLLTEDGKALIWDTTHDSPDEGKQADWMQVVEVCKRHSWSWGGDWPEGKKDRPHLQYTFGKTIKQAQQMHKAGMVRPDGYLNV